MERDTFLIEMYKALGHPIRLEIVRILKEGPLCVCDILPRLDSEQSNASQHFSVLKNAGIVKRYRKGSQMMYEVVDPLVYQLLSLSETLLKNRLDRTREALSKEG
ncbi:MAG: ArsR family transcriptional regulator [delta proteobacterium ML8_F1]|nr:MAG: ArsR family transcriptional regulator [delta proteobacterium ML8_F1]